MNAYYLGITTRPVTTYDVQLPDLVLVLLSQVGAALGLDCWSRFLRVQSDIIRMSWKTLMLKFTHNTR